MNATPSEINHDEAEALPGREPRPVRVGSFPPAGRPPAEAAERQQMVGRIAELGLDHVCAGDHVSFHNGSGRDALIDAAAMLSMHPSLPVYVGLYLLPLRHPVPVARQLATIAELAPGRLTLGVGIGGEDRHELEICGVDPRTRGRRMDECLPTVRSLLEGEPVSVDGEFISIEEALILPAPDPPIRFSVGGRSGAAVRRAAEHGEGWLAIWVSPRRFAAAVTEIDERSLSVGRDPIEHEHALNLWCGFDRSAPAARKHLAGAMADFYRMPFDPFERYCPYGTPAEVAGFLAPYVEAGCSAVNLLPCAGSTDAALEGAAEVASILRSEFSEREPSAGAVGRRVGAATVQAEAMAR